MPTPHNPPPQPTPPPIQIPPQPPGRPPADKPDDKPKPTVHAPVQVRGETGGPAGPEPTRYGDWERGGRCSDF